MSPNQQNLPPTLSFNESRSLPVPASLSELQRCAWAAHKLPYLPFILNLPFQGVMMNDHNGFHLPSKVVKSWKTLEQCCCHISSVLYTTFRWDCPKVIVMHIPPPKLSNFGYFNTHPSEEIAWSAISKSLDAFVILFAFVSFCIAINRAEKDPGSVSSLTPKKWPRWLWVLSERMSKVLLRYDISELWETHRGCGNAGCRKESECFAM